MIERPEWDRVEALYDAASALAPGERDRFLAEQCGSDHALIAEIQAMLRDDSATRTLGRIVDSAANLASQPETGSWAGRRIGPYRIVRPIGAGGMGAVFLAMRDDDQFHKEVALKTLRFETPDDVSRKRFRHERQILASLEHPHIARLLDGGATEQGSPWLVMEYVAGETLTTYCSRKQLSAEARIELFCQVCDAVQYAHQKLIVHRDIKPGNILVTEDGDPKLLDFGIAKLLDPTGEPGGGPSTGTSMGLMTPDYASPEQVRGEAATTSTDVYALGAVLYELLTGERPHRLKNYDPAEIARAICETGVGAPSRSGGARFRGDLDNIVLKATHLEPARRYGSAGQLAEDLRRFLRFMPVVARPDTFRYRARKYIRRNWFGVSALTAVMLALAAGLAVAIREAGIAEERFRQVRNLSHRFIFDFNDAVMPLPGATSVREMMVNTALEYLDNLSKSVRGDPELEWELAKAYEKVGDVQGSPVEPSLGRSSDALKSYRKSVAMQEDLARRGLLDADKSASVAHTYAQIAAIYRLTGPASEAVRAAQRGVEHARGANERSHANALNHLALALTMAGEPAQALEANRAAEPIVARVAGQETGWGRGHNSLAAVYGSIARTLTLLGRFEEASDTIRKAIDIRESRLSEPEFDILNARELVLNYHFMADVLGGNDRFNLSRAADTLPWYRKALALAERMAAGDPKNASARIEVARSQGKLAAALQATAPAEALDLFRKSLALAETLLPPGAARDDVQTDCYRRMAVSLALLGKIPEARQQLQAALAIDEAAEKRSPRSQEAPIGLAKDWVAQGQVEALTRNPMAHAAFMQALEFADLAAAAAPNDFRQAYMQVSALEGLLAIRPANRTGDAEPYRGRLIALWTNWDRRLPGTPFIRQRLRAATALP